MSYEQLDKIADAYVPTLFVITVLCYCAKAVIRKDKKILLVEVAGTLLSVVFIYLMMFVDSHFKIYSRASLDYSTHTALALVFVTTLSFFGRKAFIAVVTSMVLYCGLMLYQKYHTLADIIVTSLNVLPIIIWIHIKTRKVSAAPI